MRRARSTERAGFGLVELLIGVAILAVFLGSLAICSSSMLRVGLASDVRSELQETAATTLGTILDDLRVSGVSTPYPYLFVDGNAGAGFDVHDHAPATEHGVPGDEDHGPNREIVFVRPADADDDGEPDFDGAGALAWSADEISYVLVTGLDGINVLERRVNGRSPRTIARHVERVVFDDITTSGFELPLDAIRVRLWFRVPDGRGGTARHRIEATTRLRN
jgi:prepilin-type N-terminal cleavage/methylation domain-containing protein